MVRRIRRSTIFSLIAVVALLGLGIGYAQWTETLTINGSVQTASFDVDFGTPNVSEVDPLEVANCSANVNHLAPGDSNVLNVAVTNAYPGYSCTITVDIVNNSSIDVEMTSYSPGPVPTGLTVTPFECDGGAFQVGSIIAATESVTCNFGVVVSADTSPSTNYTLTASAQFEVATP